MSLWSLSPSLWAQWLHTCMWLMWWQSSQAQCQKLPQRLMCHCWILGTPTFQEWKEWHQQNMFSNMFATDEWDVGLANGLEYHIRLSDSTQFRERSRRNACSPRWPSTPHSGTSDSRGNKRNKKPLCFTYCPGTKEIWKTAHVRGLPNTESKNNPWLVHGATNWWFTGLCGWTQVVFSVGISQWLLPDPNGRRG